MTKPWNVLVFPAVWFALLASMGVGFGIVVGVAIVVARAIAGV